VHLAALQSIPVQLYHAATVDGAGAWQRFRRISSDAGPGHHDQRDHFADHDAEALRHHRGSDIRRPGGLHPVRRLYIIKLAFTDDRFGYASAVAMLLLVLSAVIALSVTGLLRRREVDL